MIGTVAVIGVAVIGTFDGFDSVGTRIGAAAAAAADDDDDDDDDDETSVVKGMILLLLMTRLLAEDGDTSPSAALGSKQQLSI